MLSHFPEINCKIEKYISVRRAAKIYLKTGL